MQTPTPSPDVQARLNQYGGRYDPASGQWVVNTPDAADGADQAFDRQDDD